MNIEADNAVENKKVKILYTIPCLADGGIEKMITEWIEGLDKSRYRVDVLALKTTSRASKEKLISLGCRVYDRDIRNRQITAKKKYLKKVFEEGQYDIIHQHTNFAADFINLKYAKEAGIEVRICHGHSANPEHGRINNIFHRLSKPFMRKYATIYTGCSKEACRELVGSKGVESRRYIPTGNSIDCEKLKYNKAAREKIREQYNIKDEYVIGHVGRFEAEKNHVFILDVFAESLKHKEDAKLILVGDGSLKADIQDRADKLGIEDRIIFTGNVDNVQDYYSAMDAFIFPSLYEGFGLALLEAECSGLPCIGAAELTQDAFVPEMAKRMSLKRPASQWAKAICELEQVPDREQCAEKIKKLGYDKKDNGIDVLYKI